MNKIKGSILLYLNSLINNKRIKEFQILNKLNMFANVPKVIYIKITIIYFLYFREK